MLVTLALRDFAVVRSAELRPGPGMTVISGETGAGKSLLVDALLWIVGARADTGLVRAGAARAEVEAEFDLADAPAAAAWLAENELDDAGLCQLRRVVKADGGSRAWINGRAASLGQLAALGGLLVEVHGQHEHQALLLRDRQLALLDGFGRRAGLLAPVREQARDWQAADRAIAELQARGDVHDRLELLRHQLAELDAEALDEASLATLQARHRLASQGEALLQACARAALLLGDEHGAMAPIGQALATLSRWTGDEPRLAEAAQLAESARLQLAEALALVEQAQDGFELDPEAQAETERRLSRLHDLARKHRCTLAGLAERRDALAAEQAELEGAGTRLATLLAEREALEQAWRTAAESLSAARRDDAAALSAAITGLMPSLGMAGGRFEVQLLAVDDPRPHPAGRERAEFLVSANPGQPLRPLRKVASGGELARIALAIQVAALGVDDTPTLVFDEVDAGIGGAVAEAVGQALRRLGQGRQVLCVTHLPQVAAQGHGHWRVSKASDGRDTWSEPERLDEAGRVEEVARMLGGAELTAAVRTSARQMLEKARRT